MNIYPTFSDHDRVTARHEAHLATGTPADLTPREQMSVALVRKAQATARRAAAAERVSRKGQR